MLSYEQFGIIQNLQMSPIVKTSFLVGTFFAVSYSKAALMVFISSTTTVWDHQALNNVENFFWTSNYNLF